MKQRIAIVLSLMLATGTFTACTAEEKVNDTNKTSVVLTADVSSSTGSSEPLPTENDTETTTTEKATVLLNDEPTKTDTQSEEKADSGQNSANKTQTKQSVEVKTNTHSSGKNSGSKVTEKREDKTDNKPEQKSVQTVTEPPTQKPTVKPTEKPTQPPTEAKTIDIQYVVSSCIYYGKQLGMNYDSTLNTSNASWFSPTNAEYYSDTESLLNDCYNDVEYTAYFHQDSGIEPSNLIFNVIAEENKIYIVYC